MFSARQTRTDEDRFTWIQAGGYAVIAALVVLWVMSFVNGPSYHAASQPTAAVSGASRHTTAGNVGAGTQLAMAGTPSGSATAGGLAAASAATRRGHVGDRIRSHALVELKRLRNGHQPDSSHRNPGQPKRHDRPLERRVARGRSLGRDSDSACEGQHSSRRVGRHVEEGRQRRGRRSGRPGHPGDPLPHPPGFDERRAHGDPRDPLHPVRFDEHPTCREPPGSCRQRHGVRLQRHVVPLKHNAPASPDTTGSGSATPASGSSSTSPTDAAAISAVGDAAPTGPDGTWIVPPVPGGVDALGNQLPGLPGVATGPAPAGNVLAMGSPGDQYAFDVTNRTWILTPANGYKYVPGIGYVSTAGATDPAPDQKNLPDRRSLGHAGPGWRVDRPAGGRRTGCERNQSPVSARSGDGSRTSRQRARAGPGWLPVRVRRHQSHLDPRGPTPTPPTRLALGTFQPGADPAPCPWVRTWAARLGHKGRSMIAPDVPRDLR